MVYFHFTDEEREAAPIRRSPRKKNAGVKDSGVETRPEKLAVPRRSPRTAAMAVSPTSEGLAEFNFFLKIILIFFDFTIMAEFNFFLKIILIFLTFQSFLVSAPRRSPRKAISFKEVEEIGGVEKPATDEGLSHFSFFWVFFFFNLNFQAFSTSTFH